MRNYFEVYADTLLRGSVVYFRGRWQTNIWDHALANLSAGERASIHAAADEKTQTLNILRRLTS